ncbi:complex I intermediate-associated protein 30-domain-containing protein [Polychytrium aggregatum]|uniref:complex I intermediate-associated protein 30-domain-containing protein n=1 Tax=Polychytrium aggregatum TaxID=110093 RepID=UPI0022FE38D4|nr:complex I intermediate-associated protein 30-domain-containing protein [Polychytrium aggregatum]KAI9207628.1 complex I intermediate-associated protein 30-domain-containing protein [Polychytrium aggregatum]
MSSTLGQGLRVLNAYFKRSWNYVKDESVAAIKFDMSWKKEMPLFGCNSVEELEQFTVGSDADIGGLSEAYWGLTQDNTGLFWGNLSTEVPPGLRIERSGYAGIRSKERPLTLFSRPRFDTTLFRYLAIRAKGDTRQWFVNIQTDSLYPSYLYQHRLYFQRPGEWEVLMIPFRDFVLTSHGFVQKRQFPMERDKIKTVGFSLVRQPGDFALEVDWIKAMNTEKTFGDHDLLGPGEYLDENGIVRLLPPGETMESRFGDRIRFFDDKK